MSGSLLDRSFVWIPSSSHDADSRPFYERQMARIRDAAKAREEEEQDRQETITPIRRKVAK